MENVTRKGYKYAILLVRTRRKGGGTGGPRRGQGNPVLGSPCGPLPRDGLPVVQSEAYGSFVNA